MTLLLRCNLEALLSRLIEQAPDRLAPTVSLAQGWHRAIFDGVDLPVQYYAGEVRDDDPDDPELVGYEVQVGPYRGVAAREVPTQLERFEERMQQAAWLLDDRLPVGEAPASEGVLLSVITLCAIAHGEWARIHPFANGNGRTARLWANWCALRYGLPLFVRLRPRPVGSLYAAAAADSMAGDHRATISLFAGWLEERLRTAAHRREDPKRLPRRMIKSRARSRYV